MFSVETILKIIGFGVKVGATTANPDESILLKTFINYASGSSDEKNNLERSPLYCSQLG